MVMKTRKYVPVFSPKHLSYIRACRKNMYNIAEGAVRAGKTVDNVFAFCTELETCPDKIHLASASTSPTAKLNIGDCNGMGIEAQFRGRCTWGKYRGNDCIRVRTKTGEKIVIFAGAGKADSFKRIRGNSYGMWIATEVNLHHESFIQEAFNRTAAAKLRKFFWDLNPSAPNSPIYEKYIDLYRIKQERGELPGGCNYELFLMRDNATISDERFAEIVAQYDPQSVWYKRDIEGKRVSAEGMIYPGYSSALETPFTPPRWRDVFISIDYGTQNAFAALLWGKSEGVWHIFREYRYSGRDTQVQKTDEDYVRDMERFVSESLPEDQQRSVMTIIDPSAASFIAALRRSRLAFRVRKADNDVLDGIRDVAVCMQRGDIRIFDNLPELRKEFDGYVWDDKADDKPIKVNDHLMDALRYGVRTMRLVKPKEEYKSPFFA
jgi:PBSX family phage terminase large subunit